MDLFDVFKELNISYDMLEHEAVYTVDEAKRLENMLDGVGCKNLFLTDKKGKYFLLILQEDKRAYIKEIGKIVNCSHLSFGKKDELESILNLKKGSCTPLGIINDVDNKVILLFDKELEGKRVLCHPNRNTATISLDFFDLIKFVEYFNHKYLFM